MKTIIRYGAASIAAGALYGLVRGAGVAAANRYLSLGFYRNATAVVAADVNRFAGIAFALFAAVAIVAWAAGRIAPRRPGHPRVLAVTLVAALLAWGRIGFEKNRYGFQSTWLAKVDFHGALLPRALFSEKVWLTNIGITAGCAVAALFLYFALRAAVRRDVPPGALTAARRALILVGAAGVLLLVVGNGADRFLFRRTPGGPNVLLVSLDTLRAGFLGCYGFPEATSPAIDAFARRSVLFENAYSQSAWTLPSHASFLTSRYPSVNRSVETGETGGWKVPSWRVLAMELFREGGYRTAGIVDGRFLTARFGLEQGYDDFTGWGGGAARIIPKAVTWLERHDGRPFFLFLHMYDIHSPYATEAPYTGMFQEGEYDGDLRPGIMLPQQMKRKFHAEGGPDISEADADYLQGLYAGGIRRTDEILSMLFDCLRREGLDRNTAVVLVSDHGEEFMEHGQLQHGVLFRTVTNVPLIIHLPGGAEGGRRVSRTVGLIDLLPTLLDVAGIETDVPLSGRSLLPLMRGEEDRFRRFVFSETGTGDNRTVSIIDDDHHLVGSVSRNEWELFAHPRDPMEQRDILPGERALADSLERRVAAFDDTLMKEIAADGDAPLEGIELDDRTRQALRAFGYIE